MPAGCILLVDDDAHILRVLGMSLRAAGFEVQTADGAAAALALTAAHSFEALVVDQRLHDGTGLGLLRGLRAAHPQVPAILSSGNITDEMSAEARRIGAHTLEKPYTVTALLSLLDSIRSSGTP